MSRKRLDIREERIERTCPTRGRVEFCNNKEYQEIHLRSSVLPLWMLVFALLNANVLFFDVVMIKNELWLLILLSLF